MSDNTNDAQTNDIKNRIRGMIFGHALGDAVGLVTEFKFKTNKPELIFPYEESIRGFPICDWTDETDCLAIVIRSLIANNGQLDQQDIAAGFKKWSENGITELGDTECIGISGTMRTIVSREEFADNPTKIAEDIWNLSKGHLSSNSSLTYSSAVGAFKDKQLVVDKATKLSSITHVDPRCVVSCRLHTLLLSNIIYDSPESAESVDKALFNSVGMCCEGINPDVERELSYWTKMAFTGTIDSLKLDDISKVGYVFKCLAVSIYTLQVIKIGLKFNMRPSFWKLITGIANECGDADANCAIAGSLLGAYLGYSELPQNWINALPGKEWLLSLADSFAELVLNI